MFFQGSIEQYWPCARFGGSSPTPKECPFNEEQNIFYLHLFLDLCNSEIASRPNLSLTPCKLLLVTRAHTRDSIVRVCQVCQSTLPVYLLGGSAMRHFTRDVPDKQEGLLCASKRVRVMVMRLTPYVWGNGGSFFIPLHLQAARDKGKAFYILPGELVYT